jgi:hypothetical protein
MARGAFVIRLRGKINIEGEIYRVCTWRGFQCQGQQNTEGRITGKMGEIQRKWMVIG